MHHFTRQWHSGEDESDPRDAYWAHVDAIESELPEPVRRLARDVNLHDGLIQRVQVDRPADSVSLELRCGDCQVGYFDLELVYAGVDWDRSELSELTAIADDPDTEALYDEVDRLAEGGPYVHRILWWPYREVELMFDGLTVTTTPQPDRDFERLPDVL